MVRKIIEAFNKKGDVKVFKLEREWRQLKGSQTLLESDLKSRKMNLVAQRWMRLKSWMSLVLCSRLNWEQWEC